MTGHDRPDFRVLGPLEVLVGGRSVGLGGLRQRTLVVLLLLRANEAVSRDRLIDDLWGAEPPATAANALAALVARLRRSLPAETLVTAPGGYELRVEPEALDLHRFERLVEEGSGALAGGEPNRAAELLRSALALWRGPALADFRYEAFAQPAITRLEELRLAALESRIDADLALGRHLDLVSELQSLVLEHPLRERLRGQLMLALYRAGRQAEALEAYRDARRVLVEELGIEPGPGLQELEGAILRQDPQLRGQEAAPAQPPSARAILVAATSAETLDALLAVAEPLAAHSGRELILIMLEQDGERLADATRIAQGRREVLAGNGRAVRAAAFVTTTPGDDVVRVAAEQDVDLLVVDPLGDIGAGLSSELATVLEGAPCDVGVLVTQDRPAAAAGPSRAVIVPFGGGEHEWAALEIGAWLAGAAAARLELLGTTTDPETGGRDASRLLATASLVLQQAAGVTAEPRLVPVGPEGVLEAAGDAAVTVLGLSDRWRQQGLDAGRLAVATGAASPVLLVRGGVRPGGLAPDQSLTRFTWTMASVS
ncbi:MAG TPA: BTAD domain-containing putative transcriptional regulator [Gaiellaceae bacterium]|nr:BTAD domain-containing putative transcriptional regulator [Gaiellaceae bacterium]